MAVHKKAQVKAKKEEASRETKEATKAANKETSLCGVLEKAHMSGLIKSIKLTTSGGFEVTDDSKNVLVVYPGMGKEVFAEEIGIIDLGMLIGILKTTENPDIKYKDGVLAVKEGNKEFKYLTADPMVVSSYAPATGSDHLAVRIKKIPATKIEIKLEELQDILRACSILKDASKVYIGKKGKGMSITVGSGQENSYEIQLGTEAQFEERIALPKKETQAVLEACTGTVTLELRAGDDAPVVVQEKDLTIYIGRM